MATDGSKDLAKAKKYIVNLKRWLKKEHKWQQKVRTEINRLRRKAGLPGPPAPIEPPPPPPFKP